MLVLELFGEQIQLLVVPIILDITKSKIRSGLKKKLRSNLLAKYEPWEDLAFLSPSKVNKEILSNLGVTIIAWDKHQMHFQA